MVKIIAIFILFFSLSLASNIYEANCVTCHKKEEVSLQMVFKKYLMEYSSKKRFTKNLKEYLKNPSQNKSIMPLGFIDRFGTKQPTTLTDKDLDEAIESYFEKYSPKNRLR